MGWQSCATVYALRLQGHGAWLTFRLCVRVLQVGLRAQVGVCVRACGEWGEGERRGSRRSYLIIPEGESRVHCANSRRKGEKCGGEVAQ
jgi:hypothetical protein